MKKFTLIQESVVLDKDLINLIGSFDNYRFLPYTLGLRTIIDNMLLPYTQEINFNNYKKFQLPLQLLSSTGKYPEIKNYGGNYWCHKLILDVVTVKGVWHPVNKLNTNSFDQAELLCDIIKKEGLFEDLKKNYDNESDLKNWLINFCSQNDIESLIKKHNLKLTYYVNYNRILSEYGEMAEKEVADYLSNNGYIIEYSGGDGDPIDMKFGIDLIISQGGQVFTVQVKRTKNQALIASTKSDYSRIDFFYYSNGGTIGRI